MSRFLEGLASLRKSPTTRDSRLGSDGSVTTPPPVGKEPNNMQQAKVLLDATLVSKIFPQYVPELQSFISEQLPLSGRNFIELLKLAGHPCSVNWTQKALAELTVGITEKESEKAMLLKQGKDTSMFNIPAYRTSVLQSIAALLAYGFDTTQEPNRKKRPFFIRDASDKIIGVIGADDPSNPNARFDQCDKALKRGETLLGGKRKKRQTKKKSMKKRKTLRRVRH